MSRTRKEIVKDMEENAKIIIEVCKKTKEKGVSATLTDQLLCNSLAMQSLHAEILLDIRDTLEKMGEDQGINRWGTKLK